MRYALTKFLTFSPENVSVEIYWALGFIYLALVVTTLLSVFSLRSRPLSKAAWCIIILALPVAGMALHCLRCLLTADYQFLKQYGLCSAKPHFSTENKKKKPPAGMKPSAKPTLI
ncbi:PLD nuclease N-terminal domain-containing protein [Prosthecobacter sp.]|uniref:PLD nuclease N-terminal domain-containing protein n=1 Tax=Prosthecobacter sp. TaxID=1965333 RepID=UPI003784B604